MNLVTKLAAAGALAAALACAGAASAAMHLPAGPQAKVALSTLKLVVAANRGADATEPGAWALMIVGFGAAGAALRRRREQRIYRLVEICDGGEKIEELFPAPDDTTAVARARQVAERFELWRDDQRVAG